MTAILSSFEGVQGQGYLSEIAIESSGSLEQHAKLESFARVYSVISSESLANSPLAAETVAIQAYHFENLKSTKRLSLPFTFFWMIYFVD